MVSSLPRERAGGQALRVGRRCLARRALALAGLLGVLGCSSDRRPNGSEPPASPAAPERASPARVPDSESSAAPGDEESARSDPGRVLGLPLPGPARAGGRNVPAPRAPANGCAFHDPRLLASPAAWAHALYLSGRAALLVLAADGRELALYELAEEGGFSRGASLTLAARPEQLASQCAADCVLAWVDARGQLASARLERARAGSVRVLARGVDRRFAPALARRGERALHAYVAAVGEAMHVFSLRDDGRSVSPPRDLTPAGHGAAAPTFVLGAARDTLVMIDARAGYSPLLEVQFDERGEPQPAAVRTPVSQPYAPPLLAALAWSDGRVEVVYSAVGRAAMSALGRVWLHSADPPSALLPSQSYGELRLSLARSRERALFAIELPSAPAASAPRTLLLKLSDGQDTHEVAWPTPRGSVRERPSLAAGPSPGEYLLAYVESGQVRAVRLACDEGSRRAGRVLEPRD